MVKKRSVFDIDFSLEDEEAAAPVPRERRGPMASAIAEAAQATADRRSAEEAIRAENDALAHEHVRLKKLGLITDLIPTSEVGMAKLTRDRSASKDPELEELKASIRDVGLSNPIRVEQAEEGYELIEGFRRLSAFIALAEETGDPRYNKIPATLVPRGEPLAALYRKMVDENLVRKDISFAEMAQLAIWYSKDEGVGVSEAVSLLYASALKQKKSYIRAFAKMLEVIGENLNHAAHMPRALGLDLAKALEAEPDRAVEIRKALEKAPARQPQEEQQILKKVLASKVIEPKEKSGKSVSKTTIRLSNGGAEARVIATEGKIELRADYDFSAISKAKLQTAILNLLKELE